MLTILEFFAYISAEGLRSLNLVKERLDPEWARPGSNLGTKRHTHRTVSCRKHTSLHPLHLGMASELEAAALALGCRTV